MGIVIVMHRARKRAWRRRTGRCRDADERQRYLIVGMLAEGRSAGTVAERLGCARATVVRVAHRYRAAGAAGLVDHRRFNGRAKVTAAVRRRLLDQYPAAATIHLILDNYGIHTSTPVQAALGTWAGRVRLHFPPPYCCPADNRVERLWLDLHAAVTRNHRCPTIADLLAAVDAFLAAGNDRRRHPHQEVA